MVSVSACVAVPPGDQTVDGAEQGGDREPDRGGDRRLDQQADGQDREQVVEAAPGTGAFGDLEGQERADLERDEPRDELAS